MISRRLVGSQRARAREARGAEGVRAGRWRWMGGRLGARERDEGGPVGPPRAKDAIVVDPDGTHVSLFAPLG